MSLTSSEMTPADIAAVTGNGGCNDWGGNGSWWLIVLFLFALMGNNGFGWGNGNANGAMPYLMNNSTNADVQRGFDQSAVMSGINALNASVNNGFSDMAVSQCNQTTGLLNSLYGIGNQINNSRFDTVSAITAAQNALNNTLLTNEMARQQCCCDTKQAIADVKYTIATEACADRAAVNSALRDVITAQTANTQAILDKLCQQEIDAKNTEIANLRTQLNMANLASSQTAQTAQILASTAAQTAALEQRLNPAPIPAYTVANPNCCATSSCGCGCG